MAPLLRWGPFHHLDDLLSEEETMDLATDMYEIDGSIVVKIHVPEIDPDKVDISVDGDVLHVCGSREEATESSDQNYFHQEIQTGSFERLIPLPRPVDPHGTRADYRGGVLRITLPIKNRNEAARIKVTKD